MIQGNKLQGVNRTIKLQQRSINQKKRTRFSTKTTVHKALLRKPQAESQLKPKIAAKNVQEPPIWYKAPIQGDNEKSIPQFS